MFDRIKSMFGGLFHRKNVKPNGARIKMMRASFDNAKTTDENANHWANADDKNPVQALTSDVRRKLRMRARYEAENNCYCGGLVSTLAVDLIGYTLPKLRIIDDNPAIKTLIEDEWRRWTENGKVNLSQKCRLLEETKWIEGESFLVAQSDDEVFSETGLNLNYNVVGAARVTDPYDFNFGAYKTEVYDDDTNELSGYRYEYNDDGVVINMMTGRPIKFKIVAPIDDIYAYGAMIKEPAEIDAKYCVQWFNRKRPGQYRGYSPLAPTLNLYAQLRRIDLATLTSVETAAMLAGIMKTNAPVDAPAAIKPFSKTELERGMLLSLPDGWEATQFKPEQPLQVYEMFVNIILRQIGRALDVPFGIVAGDSSKYNYSSAQLDIRGYEESRKYDQNQFSIIVMNKVFKDFLIELSLIQPVIRQKILTTGIYHNWTYAKRPSSDPQKDASAEQTRLNTYATNLSEVYSARGLDWEEELEQRKKELDKMAALGLNNAASTPVDEFVTA